MSPVTTAAGAESRALGSIYTPEAKAELRKLAMELATTDGEGNKIANYPAAMKEFWKNPERLTQVRAAFRDEGIAATESETAVEEGEPDTTLEDKLRESLAQRGRHAPAGETEGDSAK